MTTEDLLAKWEAEAKEYFKLAEIPPKTITHCDTRDTRVFVGYQNRILALIDLVRAEQVKIEELRELVRKKDELIRYCLGPTRDVKTPKLQEALALTEQLK